MTPNILTIEPVPARGTSSFSTTHCLLCGRKLRVPMRGHAYEVHCVNGWLREIVPVDQPFDNEASDMGFWPVGPECFRKLPPEYARRIG